MLRSTLVFSIMFMALAATADTLPTRVEGRAADGKLYAFFSVGDGKMLSALQKALENKS